MKKSKPGMCPNCGFAKGHAHLCQQEAVWELEERVSELEEQLQEEKIRCHNYRTAAKLHMDDIKAYRRELKDANERLEELGQ